MNLTPHFTLEELTMSSTAVRLGIDNTPSPEATANLKILATGLEKVRSLLKKPMIISSGYRCPELNAAIKGSITSAHMQGFAADFICPQFGDPLQIVKAIEQSGIIFDQVIQEGKWVHISFVPRLRRQVLTAHFDSKGNASYTQGA